MNTCAWSIVYQKWKLIPSLEIRNWIFNILSNYYTVLLHGSPGLVSLIGCVHISQQQFTTRPPD
jgi:hypothetical protein